MPIFTNTKLNFFKIKKELDKKGFSVLESRLDEKLCDQYLDIINLNLKKSKKEKKFHGNEARLVYNLTNKDFDFFKLVFDKKINKICKNYFENGAYFKDKNIHQFDHMHSRTIKNPCFAQPLHIDSRVSGIYPPTGLHFFIYLSDVNEDSGPTRLVPFSHKKNVYPKKKDSQKAIKITGKKGTVIVTNSSTWHGSSIKKNYEQRSILTLVYTRWFIRQQFALPFSIPKKFTKKFTNNEKILLGFYNYPPIDERHRKTSRGKIKNYIIK